MRHSNDVDALGTEAERPPRARGSVAHHPEALDVELLRLTEDGATGRF